MVSPKSPDFDAALFAWPILPISPVIDEMLMIRPEPRSTMCSSAGLDV